MREVVRIPAKTSKEISIIMLGWILLQVPKGRLTRLKDIEEVFKEFYGVEIITFEGINISTFFKRSNNHFTADEAFDFYYQIPWWRLVSNTGFINKLPEVPFEELKEKLKKERFKFADHGKIKECRIDNYKKYLVKYKIREGIDGDPILEVIK